MGTQFFWQDILLNLLIEFLIEILNDLWATIVRVIHDDIDTSISE